MAWVKLDDNFFDHEKVVGLSVHAKLLYIVGLTYCSRHLTDGKLPDPAILGRLACVDDAGAAADELVDSGLWKRSPKGALRVTRYAKHQRTKAEVTAERDAARERMRRWRAKKLRRDIPEVTPTTSEKNRVDTPLSPPKGGPDATHNLAELAAYRAAAKAPGWKGSGLSPIEYARQQAVNDQGRTTS